MFKKIAEKIVLLRKMEADKWLISTFVAIIIMLK